MDKIRLSGFVERSTEQELNIRNDVVMESVSIGLSANVLVDFISRYPAFLSFLCTRCTTLSGIRSVV